MLIVGGREERRLYCLPLLSHDPNGFFKNSISRTLLGGWNGQCKNDGWIEKTWQENKNYSYSLDQNFISFAALLRHEHKIYY